MANLTLFWHGKCVGREGAIRTQVSVPTSVKVVALVFFPRDEKIPLEGGKISFPSDEWQTWPYFGNGNV